MSENTLVGRATFPTVSVYKDRRIPEYYSSEEISGILSAVDSPLWSAH